MISYLAVGALLLLLIMLILNGKVPNFEMICSVYSIILFCPELLDKSVIIPNIESLQEVEKTIMSVLDGDLVILSANNWEHSKEYSYDIISKRLLSFYREVVNSSSGLIN